MNAEPTSVLSTGICWAVAHAVLHCRSDRLSDRPTTPCATAVDMPKHPQPVRRRSGQAPLAFAITDNRPARRTSGEPVPERHALRSARRQVHISVPYRAPLTASDKTQARNSWHPDGWVPAGFTRSGPVDLRTPRPTCGKLSHCRRADRASVAKKVAAQVTGESDGPPPCLTAAAVMSG